MKHALLHAITAIPNLNYKRGLTRLYAIAATLWIAAVTYAAATRPIRLSEVDAGMERISHAAALALGPPFAVYMLGLSLGWALSGFRR